MNNDLFLYQTWVDYLCEKKCDINVLYDETVNIDKIKNQKGLTLYETWFVQTIIMNQSTNCVINSEKYEIEDLLLAFPELRQSFHDKIIYSRGDNIGAIIVQYWNNMENNSCASMDDLTAPVSDGDVAHAITMIGIDKEYDLILYFDTESNTLLTPQYMPALKQGGFLYNNAYAILRTEFEKIVYAILIPETEN